MVSSHFWRSHFKLWHLAPIILVLAGCEGGGIQRYPVSGAVTYQGKPVDYGAISFEPTESAGAIAPTCHAPIRNGVYDTGTKGPTEGLYSVIVHGMDESKNYVDSGGMIITPSLFREYKFEVRIPPPGNKLDIEVPSGADSPRRK